MTQINRWQPCLIACVLVVWSSIACCAQSDEGRVLRIVDGQGSPVSSAAVLAYDGRFGKVLDAAEDGTWRIDDDVRVVVAKADQFQFSGLLVNQQSSREIQIVLPSLQTSGREYEVLPSPITDDQRAALRRELLERLERQLSSVEDEPRRVRILQAIARHDPELGAALLQEKEWRFSSRTQAMIQNELVRYYASSDPLLALEMIGDVSHDVMQAFMLQTLLQELPAESPLRQSCQNQALRRAEAVAQPQLRFAALAQLAEKIELSGERELARRITQANIAMAEELPSEGWSIYSRSLFAALIVNDDPERAVQIVSDSAQSLVPDKLELQRAWARVAFACCHKNPDLATQLLSNLRSVDPENAWNTYASRAIQWMAVKQPRAAIEEAEAIEDPVGQASLMGVIASRCFDEFPDLSRDVLLKTAAALFEHSERLHASKAKGSYHPAPIVVGLLPVYERVAPDQLESMVWQTLWMSVPRSRFSLYRSSNSEVVQHASAALRRYDLVLSEALLDERELELSLQRDHGVGSWLALQPEQLANFLDKVERENLNQLTFVVDAALDMLSADETQFWNTVCRPSIWVDEADVFE